MIVGMDFGTTNSGMAVFDGRQVRLLSLDPDSGRPHVARTALYISNDQSLAIGRTALNRYFDENIGRPVKMKKVWVGEVEVYGADMFYVTDVYAWTDVLSPGRLFLSLKSGLRDPEYQGTVVGQYYYSLENLIATYLSLNRMRAQELLGQPVRQVVLGRPVRFSSDPAADRLAERRLLDAAFRAGFERVYLQYEPVAAAYHYAQKAGTAQNVLVFDFGGGTLDLTVMRLEKNGRRQVLSTGGVPIAGDVFDQKLVRARLPRHFGERSRYGPPGRRLPVPRWVFDAFSSWQDIIQLQTRESRKLLEDMARTADDPSGIEGLISLVTNNYGLYMFDKVEAVKRELSEKMAAMIRLEGPGFRVREMVTRSAFEQIIGAEIQAIEEHLNETLAASGLQAGQIDAVVRTGGSSRVPVFRYMLMEKFGPKKVLETDTFSGVTSGLSIIAHGVSAGTIEAEAHVPERQARPSAASGRPGVPPVNLDLLLRRAATETAAAEGAQIPGRLVLVKLTAGGLLETTTLPDDRRAPVSLIGAGKGAPASVEAACLVTPGDPLLLLTSRYRFFLTSADQLADMEQLGLTVQDFFHLGGDERLTAVAAWTPLKAKKKLLLATSRGYVRSYPLPGFIEIIEGPTPLQLDRPLPGVPLAALGGGDGLDVIVALDSGRMARYSLDRLPLQGLQAINRRHDDRLVAALVVSPEDELVLMSAGGYGRRLPSFWVAAPERPNTRGKVMIARRPLSAVARLEPGEPALVLTDRRLLPLQADRLPGKIEESTRSYRFVKLASGERVQRLPAAR